MKMDFTDALYQTLIGVLCQEYRVPGVEDLYAQGAPCDILYQKMWDAYERLLDRLGRIDDDEDLDIIVDTMTTICKETSYAMYRCGEKFAALRKPGCSK